jgi:Bacterial regulatory helix-turn-helix protein, lysR family
MNMRPELLKTFLAVARSRNITRAAALVHLAQSSVSDQVQLLEAELGATLFIRSKRGLELTLAGETLKPYAEEILPLVDETRAAIETTAGQAAIVSDPPQQRAIQFTFDDPLRGLQVERREQLMSSFNVSGRADDMVEGANLLEQFTDPVFLRDLGHDRLQFGWIP